MKNKLLNTVLLVSLTAMAACNNVEPPGPIDNVSQVVYPAMAAKQDMAYFDTLCSAFMAAATGDSVNNNNVPVRGFTIRAVDLFAAMGMDSGGSTPVYDHIRVYLGYNKRDNKFKLFLVPVSGAHLESSNAGKDVMLHDDGSAFSNADTNYTAEYLQGKFVLDLNAPCPSLCDATSPLLSE